MKRQDFDHSRFEGVDIDIEISLKEYGIAWIEAKSEYLFYYGIHQTENEGDIDHDRFDFCSIDKSTDIKKEYDWVDWEAILAFSGLESCDNWEDWMEVPFPQQIFTLVQYYGHENVFGESDWRGLAYDEIGVTEE